nr:MAG TPA: cysteine-rich protein [Caudoviricetes sp.]
MKGVDKCKYCGNDNEFKLIPCGPHMGIYCAKCSKWLKWVKRKEVDKNHQITMEEYMASLDNKNNNSELSDEEITEAYFGELPWE